MINSMTNKFITGIAVAISFFVLFAWCSSSIYAQVTIVQPDRGYTLTQNTTITKCVAPGGCTNCDQHCVTIDMKNTSDNCTITQVDISGPAGICFSICCAGIFGVPSDANCTTALKSFTGTMEPYMEYAPNPGIASFSICYTGGTGLQTFTIATTGIADDPPPPIVDCARTNASVTF